MDEIREKCEICHKSLSIYNKSGVCYHHGLDPDFRAIGWGSTCSSGVVGLAVRATQNLENGYSKDAET